MKKLVTIGFAIALTAIALTAHTDADPSVDKEQQCGEVDKKKCTDWERQWGTRPFHDGDPQVGQKCQSCEVRQCYEGGVYVGQETRTGSCWTGTVAQNPNGSGLVCQRN